MNTKIEKLPENLVKVEIEIPAKDAVGYYNNAAKRLAQYVNIPGFRKGKAPRNILEQHIGEDRIKHEALESALPKIFSEVIKENEFDVVAQPYVESYDYKIGEDMKIVAKIELRPEVTLGEYKGLTVKEMKRFISTRDEKEVVLFERVCEIAENKQGKYAVIKKWFLNNYKDEYEKEIENLKLVAELEEIEAAVEENEEAEAVEETTVKRFAA